LVIRLKKEHLITTKINKPYEELYHHIYTWRCFWTICVIHVLYNAK
jgi:hypothetical protein